MSPIATGRYIRRELMVEPRSTYHLIAWEYDAFLIWSWRYGGSVCDFLRSGGSVCVKMKWRALLVPRRSDFDLLNWGVSVAWAGVVDQRAF